jgi:hypothetical protein
MCSLFHCDADPMQWRSPHTAASAMSASWVSALAGGGLYSSDDLVSLKPERQAWQLSPVLLTTARQATGAIPDPIIPETIPAKLPHASVAKRIFFQNNIAPHEVWKVAGGKKLRINFTARKKLIDGVKIAPHSAAVSP